MTQLYRMHDAEPRGVFEVTRDEARAWNTPERGHGVFRTVNTFAGARRIENLERLNAWAIDMDDGTKEEQRARILGSPLVPSIVVETKRGHQCYWRAKDAKREHWNAIVFASLVPHFGADKNARDIARILRAPGFLHLKDPADPFLVRIIHRFDVGYTEREMWSKFGRETQAESDRRVHDEVRREHSTHGDDFWERVWHLDCRDALTRLSGHRAVNGEQFTFRRTARGTWNIFVNGKGTSCWVDAEGRIGSHSHGGPTIFQWLTWYGNGQREAIDTIKSVFPETERA